MNAEAITPSHPMTTGYAGQTILHNLAYVHGKHWLYAHVPVRLQQAFDHGVTAEPA